jgi:8-oxo-dGTP pyrophosphatase MutT (NUDIX family)
MAALRSSAHVLFVNASGEVLLRLRDARPGVAFSSQWDLVGGAVEAGETITEAALRGAKEELGLDVQSLEYFGEYPEAALNNVFVAPLALREEDLGLGEGQRLRYVGAVEARTLALVPWVARLLDDFFFVAERSRRAG